MYWDCVGVCGRYGVVVCDGYDCYIGGGGCCYFYCFVYVCWDGAWCCFFGFWAYGDFVGVCVVWCVGFGGVVCVVVVGVMYVWFGVGCDCVRYGFYVCSYVWFIVDLFGCGVVWWVFCCCVVVLWWWYYVCDGFFDLCCGVVCGCVGWGYVSYFVVGVIGWVYCVFVFGCVVWCVCVYCWWLGRCLWDFLIVVWRLWCDCYCLWCC